MCFGILTYIIDKKSLGIFFNWFKPTILLINAIQQRPRAMHQKACCCAARPISLVEAAPQWKHISSPPPGVIQLFREIFSNHVSTIHIKAGEGGCLIMSVSLQVHTALIISIQPSGLSLMCTYGYVEYVRKYG